MKKYKAMTVENIQKINELYQSGKTCKQIAAELGYGHQTVANYVMESRGRGNKLTLGGRNEHQM